MNLQVIYENRITRWIKGSNSKFALWVSLCNFIGYCVSVGGPIILDPQLKHRVPYGKAEYHPDLLTYTLPVLIFAVTYIINSRRTSPACKGVLTFLAILLTWGTMYIFAPQVPHSTVLFFPIWFGLLAAMTTFIRNYDMRFTFVNDNSIDKSARIERIKMEHDFWFKILFMILGYYVMLIIYSYINLRPGIASWVKDPKEVEIGVIGFTAAMVIITATFLLYPFRECLFKLREIRGYLIFIKSA